MHFFAPYRNVALRRRPGRKAHQGTSTGPRPTWERVVSGDIKTSAAVSLAGLESPRSRPNFLEFLQCSKTALRLETMSFRSSLAVTAAVLGAVASARDVPSNVKSFYDGIRAQKQCRNVLAGGFHSVQGDSGSTSQPSPPPPPLLPSTGSALSSRPMPLHETASCGV